jgi:hypothetical protein
MAFIVQSRTASDNNKQNARVFVEFFRRIWTLWDEGGWIDGRGGGIRTPDPLVPNQMRYQTALRPDSF